MKREMEKMTATFTAEEAGRRSADDVRRGVVGRPRKRRSKKKKNDDDEGEGEDLWGGDRAFSRKSSTVQPLGGWVDGLGASFNVAATRDGRTRCGFRTVCPRRWRSQPEGDPEEVKETREEKEARRQRRREKREKRESRRREREEAD